MVIITDYIAVGMKQYEMALLMLSRVMDPLYAMRFVNVYISLPEEEDDGASEQLRELKKTGVEVRILPKDGRAMVVWKKILNLGLPRIHPDPEEAGLLQTQVDAKVAIWFVKSEIRAIGWKGCIDTITEETWKAINN